LSSGRTPSLRYIRRRAAIVDTAAQVFNERGLHGATLAAVASAVSLDLTSLRHYFRRKEDLVAACLEHSFDVYDAMVREAEGASSPEEAVRRLMAALFRHRLAVRAGDRPDVIGFTELDAVGGQAGEAMRQRLAGLWRSVRALLQPAGAPRAGWPVYGGLAYGLLSQVLLLPRWLAYYEANEFDRVEARLVDILLNGLAGSAGASDFSAPGALMEPAEEERRSPDDFLRAATLLFNTHGYHGVSVDAIAARLNVTKGSFYHHLPGKDGLLRACMEHTLARFAEAQKAALREPTGLGQVQSASARLVRRQHPEGEPLLRLYALPGLEASLEEIAASGMAAIQNRFSDMLNDGVIDGSVRPCDTRIASQLLCAAVVSADGLSRWVPSLTGEAAVECYLRPVIAGLSPTLERYRLFPPVLTR